jgi:hypothetical protein
MRYDDAEQLDAVPSYREIGPKRERTAVKNYSCAFCGGRIVPGQRYRSQAYEQDGEVGRWREHATPADCGSPDESPPS